MRIEPKTEIILEGGWYPATIEGVEEKETQFGEKLMLPYAVRSGNELVEITAFVSLSDHPKSNIVKWGKALFGERPFDTEEFEGAKCEVFIEEGEDKEGAAKNFIRKVRAPKNAQEKKSAPTPVAEEVEDEEDFNDIPF
jgi:hypothetical protein